MLEVGKSLLILWLALGVQMVLVWRLSVKLNFLSIVDFFWASGIGVASIFLMFFLSPPSDHAWVLFFIILAWSMRLSGYLGSRLRRHYPVEDPRYEPLKANWSKPKVFLFFQAQAGIQLILLYPIVVSLNSESKELHIFEICAFVLSVLSLVGESLADYQLKNFKISETQSGKNGVCDVGLWRYSRHPNYFFEWLFWVGVSASVVTLAGGWLAVVSPLVMLGLLIFVTGVQPAEERSLKSKGVAYELYQQRTSRFFPWFPKKNVDR